MALFIIRIGYLIFILLLIFLSLLLTISIVFDCSSMGLKNNHDVSVAVDVALWVVLWVVARLGIDFCIFDKTVTFIIYPILLINRISSIPNPKQQQKYPISSYKIKKSKPQRCLLFTSLIHIKINLPQLINLIR